MHSFPLVASKLHRLILVMRREFLKFCYDPQQWHHELGLCVVLFARVEHNFAVGVDLVNLLATTSLVLFRWHHGM